MNTKTNINPASRAWLETDDYPVADYFDELGFRSLQQVLEMRVYDLMNMNRLNPIRVEEIITCLYRFLNNNPDVDQAMYEGTMSQDFDFAAWRKKHKDSSRVIVSDIVLTNGMNLKALQHIYDVVRRRFFKSGEYNWHEYRYRDYKEYLESRKNGGND